MKDALMKSLQRQHGLAIVRWLAGILAGAILLFVLYTWVMLSWSYSYGERAGWIQKLSKKGYLCKTWEGEMAMVSLPGSVPEKFLFTIRDEQAAEQINKVMGRRVAVQYEQHIGLPSSCFGETQYFVKGVAVMQDSPAPVPLPPPLLPPLSPPLPPPVPTTATPPLPPK